MATQSRRANFVDRQVQGALVRRVIMHWCIFIAVAIMAVTVFQLLVGNPELTWREHIVESWRQYAFFVVILIALLPAFLLDTIKLSNRFVGPVLRLRRALRQVADGEEVDRLKFRGHDFWSEIATEFNRACDRFLPAQDTEETTDSEQVKSAS